MGWLPSEWFNVGQSLQIWGSVDSDLAISRVDDKLNVRLTVPEGRHSRELFLGQIVAFVCANQSGHFNLKPGLAEVVEKKMEASRLTREEEFNVEPETTNEGNAILREAVGPEKALFLAGRVYANPVSKNDGGVELAYLGEPSRKELETDAEIPSLAYAPHPRRLSYRTYLILSAHVGLKEADDLIHRLSEQFKGRPYTNTVLKLPIYSSPSTNE